MRKGQRFVFIDVENKVCQNVFIKNCFISKTGWNWMVLQMHRGTNWLARQAHLYSEMSTLPFSQQTLKLASLGAVLEWKLKTVCWFRFRLAKVTRFKFAETAKLCLYYFTFWTRQNIIFIFNKISMINVIICITLFKAINYYWKIQ